MKTLNFTESHPVSTPFELASGELVQKGWVHIPRLFSGKFLGKLWSECKSLEGLHYTPENLERHSVYMSDASKTRISHAMMVTRGKSRLPHHEVGAFPSLVELLTVYEGVMKRVLGISTVDSRFMLNWQHYLGQSKPVPEHFDGEYLRFQKVGTDGYALRVDEAIMPRFVMIVTVHNENKELPQGVVLRDSVSGKLTSPRSEAGDLLVFDNIRFCHLVPSLPLPRRIIGLRGFDLAATHFVRESKHQKSRLGYRKFREGWISEPFDSTKAQEAFLRTDWPKVWAQTNRDGAVY